MLPALCVPAEHCKLKVLVDGTLELGHLLRRYFYVFLLICEHIIIIFVVLILIGVHVR